MNGAVSVMLIDWVITIDKSRSPVRKKKKNLTKVESIIITVIIRCGATHLSVVWIGYHIWYYIPGCKNAC